MRKLKAYINSTKSDVDFNKYAGYFWMFLIIPTVIWWKDAVWFVSFMSLYTIIVGHYGNVKTAHAQQEIHKLLLEINKLIKEVKKLNNGKV